MTPAEMEPQYHGVMRDFRVKLADMGGELFITSFQTIKNCCMMGLIFSFASNAEGSERRKGGRELDEDSFT